MIVNTLVRRASLVAVALLLLVCLAAMAVPTMPILRHVATAAVFVTSYAALAVGGVPGLAIDRAGVALVGAGLMVAIDAIPLTAAYRAIDLDTITLLLGMMIVVANLRLSGFFAVATHWVLRRIRHPLGLLAAIIAISGVFSAFLVNDAICLVLAPLVLDLAIALGRRPMPYLLAVAMASNIGSVATITGNPQNMIIGGISAIPYARFAGALAPVALAGLVLCFVLIALVHRGDFHRQIPASMPPATMPANGALILRAVGATLAMVVLFFAGVAPAKAAIILGGLLLLTRRLKAARIYAAIDWSLLLMFAGLFIIVAGAERQLLGPDMIAAVSHLHLDRVPVLTLVTAALSNLVSNVPAVLVLKPFVTALADPAHGWLTVAMASTLAGNFTILGSIANLIVVEKAAGRGVRIGFWAYARIGMPLAVLSLVLGAAWLAR